MRGGIDLMWPIRRRDWWMWDNVTTGGGSWGNVPIRCRQDEPGANERAGRLVPRVGRGGSEGCASAMAAADR
ncbi:hypothetical protein chiPu_0003111 [Chiloscyllium punctatum]|uniref:Uncharacterized protein n=1 Tax=Chiloscyllium punctatum TaxID=137246 RepID=A0A401S2Y6_CHIPU|nr:hypothetical protein [Chiloscyllium punctatum]